MSAETSLATRGVESAERHAAEGTELQTVDLEQPGSGRTLDEEKTFKSKTINIFYLLDQDCDVTLFRKELEPFIKIIREMVDSSDISEEQRKTIVERT